MARPHHGHVRARMTRRVPMCKLMFMTMPLPTLSTARARVASMAAGRPVTQASKFRSRRSPSPFNVNVFPPQLMLVDLPATRQGKKYQLSCSRCLVYLFYIYI